MARARRGALDIGKCSLASFQPSYYMAPRVGAELGVWACPLFRLWPSYGREKGGWVDRGREGPLTDPSRPNCQSSLRPGAWGGAVGGRLWVYWRCWSRPGPEAHPPGAESPATGGAPRKQSREGRGFQWQNQGQAALHPTPQAPHRPSGLNPTPPGAEAGSTLLSTTHDRLSITRFPFTWTALNVLWLPRMRYRKTKVLTEAWSPARQRPF